MNTRAQQHQQDLEKIKNFRYMDDDFMTACLKDNYKGVELILRIVLNRPTLKVKSIKVQEVLKNLWGRSAGLDVLAEDEDKEEIDIEIQRADAGAGAKRARHNSSLLDAHILRPGEDTDTMPDSYVVFITENDVIGENQALYHIQRYIETSKGHVLFGDGSHIIYVNGKYRGNDDVGRLMHDFSCTDPNDMHFEELAKRARYFKENEKGVAAMCKVLEDMRNEEAMKTAKKVAIRLIKLGQVSLEDIADCTELPLDTVKELESLAMQLA